MSTYCSLFILLLVSVSCDSRTLGNSTGVFDSINNADLSPRGPRQVNRRTPSNLAGGPGSIGRFEHYPGRPGSVVKIPKIAGARQTGEGYELNFADAPLSELAKVVLGDTLKLNYSFDPRVQGRVTVSTGRAVSREELLAVLESVLQMNQAALVREGNRYQIVPLSAARQSATRVVSYARERQRVGPGYGISVFPLRHVSSASMMRMLQSFAARPGTLRAETSRNLLLIRGTGRERRTLLEVAATFDVDWLKGQSAGIFPITHATSGEMIQELNGVFQSGRAGIGNGVVRFQAIERLNAVLALANDARVLDTVAKWIRRLDRTNAAGVNLYVYRVENGKAKDLANVLNDTFDGQVSVRRNAAAEVAPNQQPDTVQSANTPGRAANANAAANRPPPRRPSPNRSRTSLGEDVRIIADETNNKLLIKATGRDYRKILGVLQKIDRPPLQVLINATIAEVTLNKSLRYGVQVFLRNNNPQGAIGVSNSESLTISPSVPGFNFLVGNINNPKVVLDALSSKTAVKVVSSPSLVVLDNQTATLQVGDEVPVATREVQGVEATAPTINTIERRKTGVILKVTPRVNSSGLVTMEIEQEISNVVNTTTVGDTDRLNPTISQRKIQSVIAVYSGQMVVLGGLISERQDNIKSRVPVWEYIPILGDLVGETDKGKSRTEIIIFLQPKVIRNGNDASLIAQEFRAKLQLMAPPPRNPYPNRQPGRQDAKQPQKNFNRR